MDPNEPSAPEPPVHDTLRELLQDHDVREQLVGILAGEIESRREPSRWRRLQPWLAGAASAFVTVLAFFLPSLQDQWDRWQSRQVIQRYVELGRDFMHEGRFKIAEETFAKAFELSESRRLDIEEERLAAKVARVNEDPAWGETNPEGLEESDFLYLLHLQEGRGAEQRRELRRLPHLRAAFRRGREHLPSVHPARFDERLGPGPPGKPALGSRTPAGGRDRVPTGAPAGPGQPERALQPRPVARTDRPAGRGGDVAAPRGGTESRRRGRAAPAGGGPRAERADRRGGRPARTAGEAPAAAGAAEGQAGGRERWIAGRRGERWRRRRGRAARSRRWRAR
jgi:hypothetical protein